MAVNNDKLVKWDADIIQSVDLYNAWFMKFVPMTFRETLIQTTENVKKTFALTNNLTGLTPELLKQHPEMLPILRMCTCPPLAKDRVSGLANVSKTLMKAMEVEERIPPTWKADKAIEELTKILTLIRKLIDTGIFPWLSSGEKPSEAQFNRASFIVADRLCTAVADPIIRNAQEARQRKVLTEWLTKRKYEQLPAKHGYAFDKIPPGKFTFILNVEGKHKTKEGAAPKTVHIPIDAVIMRKTAKPGDYPLLIEAKSAGDFTNTNKRQKEESQKIAQLREHHGAKLEFILLLCGYFGNRYLEYSAAEDLDWVWEHRLDDLALFGL